MLFVVVVVVWIIVGSVGGKEGKVRKQLWMIFMSIWAWIGRLGGKM